MGASVFPDKAIPDPFETGISSLQASMLLEDECTLLEKGTLLDDAVVDSVTCRGEHSIVTDEPLLGVNVSTAVFSPDVAYVIGLVSMLFLAATVSGLPPEKNHS